MTFLSSLLLQFGNMIKRKIGSSFGGKIPSVSEPHVDDSHLIDESQLIYNKDKKIGCGGSATVYTGSFMGKSAAFKVYNFENPNLPFVKNVMLREAAELASLDHDHIIKCYGVCVTKGVIVLEYASKLIELYNKIYEIHSLRQLLDCIPAEEFSVELR